MLPLAAVAAGCASRVEVGPSARAFAPSVTTVVALPTSVDWGGPSDQRRLQRRTGDRLLELTGGRAVIAEELTRGDDDASVREALQALGEDAATTITFSLHLGIGRRLINNPNPITSFRSTRRLVVDYTAQIEVRRMGAAEVIGTIELISSGPANDPEVGPNGERSGPLEAIDRALEAAVREFAPRLLSPPRQTLVVEVPAAAARTVVGRLAALGELYPELPAEDMQRLGQSRERFLVVDPGLLAGLGVERGDLLGVPGGDTGASRAALLRAVAHGRRPLLAIVRGGQHYLIANGS